MKKAKHLKKRSNIKRIFFVCLLIIFVIGISYIFYYCYMNYKEKKDSENILNNILIEEEPTETRTERMIQLEELQKINNEIIGWLEIEGTNINYPVMQTTDNDYYLWHNYKKEQANSGGLFLDKNFNLEKPSSNYLIYGHRTKTGIMFDNLEKYKKEEFYQNHKIIKFTTNKEDAKYEVLAVFYSKIYNKTDTNVFRYYFFVDANNEEEYNDFVSNAKKASIYDTGVNANYGDQLLTLSTCEYSQKDGRFAIVARKINNF